MTKGELIRFMEPFTDDIYIVLDRVDNDDTIKLKYEMDYEGNGMIVIFEE